jgi:hypothetical protein
MTQHAFDPTDPASWRARGRSPDHAALLAKVWRQYPDLPPSASAEDRMERGRLRIAALRPINDAIAAETERQRQQRNFAFTERQLAAGQGSDRDVAILRGRDVHGYDWDRAIRYVDGWYAAHAGWDYRPFISTGGGHADALQGAYDRGFHEGGGDTADLFDTARRAIRAAERLSDLPLPPIAPAVARPLPSDWPKPTDAPRPTRWDRRLLIIEGKEPRPVPAGTAALDHFQGEHFARIRAHPGAQGATMVILSAVHGFVLATDIMQPAGISMTTARAADLASDAAQRDRLRACLAGREVDDILVIADAPSIDVIDAHASALPLCRSMERTRNTPLQRKAQLQVWLDRGLAPGAVMGSGHIRWGKVAKGLTGRLGEFTAHYAGPTPGRGHRILIKHTDGTIATGCVAPTGEPLDPYIHISNRSRLRVAMTQALRSFAGSIPMPATVDGVVTTPKASAAYSGSATKPT